VLRSVRNDVDVVEKASVPARAGDADDDDQAGSSGAFGASRVPRDRRSISLGSLAFAKLHRAACPTRPGLR